MWGGSFAAIKVGLEELTPMELVCARFIPSALLLLGINFLRPNPRKEGFAHIWKNFSPRNKVIFLLCSFFAVPGYHISLNTGETFIPSSWASLVISLNPTCITLLSALILRERVTLHRWVGLGISLLGLWIMILGSNDPTDRTKAISLMTALIGVVITLGAVLSWGFYTVLSRYLMDTTASLPLLTGVISVGTLLTLPWAGPHLWVKLANGSPQLWGSVIFLSVGCTVIGFILWFWAIRRWEVSRVGLFIYLVPLVAMLVGHFVFSEPLTRYTLLGSGAILGGVILGSRPVPSTR